ncbi:hypothetical protein QYF61_002118 [Mycteria americana]|uniref:ribonuclease H n=1 Tax=Mycteria americana TaxID=33587 RepID=A0AAN7NW40_MYCAM|nr:hypothetical protein QYF61_002118 [Mycteria americana]
MDSPLWSRLLAGTVACSGPMLEQSIPEGLYHVEITHTGAVNEVHRTGQQLPGVGGSPGVRQGRAWQPGPVPPPQPEAGQLGGTRAAPAPGIGHVSGDGVGMRLGQDMVPWVGPAQQGPWLGKGGPWGAGDRHCCNVSGAGTDGHGGLKWGPGLWAGCWQQGLQGSVREERPGLPCAGHSRFQPAPMDPLQGTAEPSSQVSRLEVHKKLGGDTAGTADPNWPKGYSIPDDVMLSDKSWGKKRGMFRVMVFDFLNLGFPRTLKPSSYKGAEPICISGVTGGSQQLTVLEAEVSLTGNEWQKHPIVTGPEAPCILGIDYLRRGYFKNPKGYWWTFGTAALETEEIKQQSTLPGLLEDRSVSQGVISKAHSPFNSPIWPVQKFNGEWRLTVDCRCLNEVTPSLSVAVLDMLELQYKLQPQFAFTWRGIQDTWNRLPQGWKHSPTICHGLIHMALEQAEAPEHLQYIDDIIVLGNTAEEVLEKGKKIVQILLKAGFAIKQSKVKRPAQEIQFLGIKWEDGHHQIPMDMINKITAMSPPPSKKETPAFLGVVGFWRMHIPNCSLIVSPLYQVTQKKNDFKWGPEQ